MLRRCNQLVSQCSDVRIYDIQYIHIDAVNHGLVCRCADLSQRSLHFSLTYTCQCSRLHCASDTDTAVYVAGRAAADIVVVSAAGDI